MDEKIRTNHAALRANPIISTAASNSGSTSPNAHRPATAMPLCPRPSWLHTISLGYALARTTLLGRPTSCLKSGCLGQTLFNHRISERLHTAKISKIANPMSERKTQGTRRKSVCAKSAHCTLFACPGSSRIHRIANLPCGSPICTIGIRQRCGGVAVDTPNQEDSANAGCSDFPDRPRRATTSTSQRPRIVRG